MHEHSIKIKIHLKISEIPKDQWNALVLDNNPFIRHEFLKALEDHHCVGEEYGWLPRHIGIYKKDEQGQPFLIGAMPLYEKYNSYGEFVFDHAWADAWKRTGLNYFPKLVSSIPYTPAQCQRLLVKREDMETITPLLLNTALQIAKQEDMSSCHILFPTSEEHSWLEKQVLLTRHDCQFHWHNLDYQTFDDFLAQLTPKKRKNIRQERKRVASANISFRVLDGETATDEDWDDFSRFYLNTFAEKRGTATLNKAFFKQVALTLPKQVVLVLANQDNKCVAGSLMYRSDSALYGRFWGQDEPIDKLHFEACYYQGIEYCIKHGLSRFEPGAQGEHKIARGFVPTLTKSSHWLNDNPYQEAIKKYVLHEQEAVADYMKNCNQHSPYKKLE